MHQGLDIYHGPFLVLVAKFLRKINAIHCFVVKISYMKKILVVDDDLDFLFTIKSILTDRGFVVDTVHSQDDIYRSILVFDPTVILLDVYLNGADGRNICRGLKNHFRTKNIPVIFCSGDKRLKDDYSEYLAE